MSAPTASQPQPPVAVVTSRYNASVTGPMLQAARDVYAQRGGDASAIAVIDAPGSFELSALAAAAAVTGRYAGVLALGCIIKGETDHDRHIAAAVAHGLTDVAVRTGVPCAFGVLTVNSAEQAHARAGGALGNKGAEAMHALLDTIAAIDTIRRANAPAVSSRIDRVLTDKPGAGAAR